MLEPNHLRFVGEKLETGGAATPMAGGESIIGDRVPLETVERQHISGVLRATGGNKNQAAQILGIDRTTLYNKIKKYQIN